MSEVGTTASAAPREGRWRRIRKAAAISAVAILIAAGSFAAWIVLLGPLPLGQARNVSTTIVEESATTIVSFATRTIA